MNTNDYSIVYIMDAYCGWCYGFSDSISIFHENNPEVSIEVLSGGLFTNERSLAIKNYPHIPQANKKISQATGAIFGERYEELLREGNTILNSEHPAIGLSALKSLDSTKGVEYAAEIQKSFYLDGKNLNDNEVYLSIADKFGLDRPLLKEKLASKEILDSAHNDFIKSHTLKVEGYPTLLLKQDQTYTYLGGSLLTPHEIEYRIKKLIS